MLHEMTSLENEDNDRLVMAIADKPVSQRLSALYVGFPPPYPSGRDHQSLTR
jgi:hypothetical protein